MPTLLEELEVERQTIKTDQYKMSIGELISLYKDDDIQLDPAYQRLFRWNDEQKTRFIESILIGIPVPEIFVAQKEDAKWTVVDGVQRISTILQLIGELEGYDALTMTETKYLPSLKGMTWDSMPEEAKRIFKRSSLGLNIILTENSIDAQYELFQRLNTGGLHLEDQEIRNCLIIMLNENFYEKINELKDYPSFKNCLKLPERRYDEEYHMELILRFFIAIRALGDFDADYSLHTVHLRELIDKETIKLIEDEQFNLDSEIDKFKAVFDWLENKMGADAFKRYDSSKDSFGGQFSNASFEVITTGLALNFDRIKDKDESEFCELVKGVYADSRFVENTRHGIRSPIRFKELTKLSVDYFSNI